jgi:hypothetical protein
LSGPGLSGNSGEGRFAYSLNFTDIHTAWVETGAILGKGSETVGEALEEIRERLPLEAFKRAPLGARYPMIAKSWRANWQRVIPFLAFPREIRRVIYTTNPIESLNFSLRKIIKTRGHFPSEEAATKLLYLALVRAEQRWTMPIWKWKDALNQFARNVRLVIGRPRRLRGGGAPGAEGKKSVFEDPADPHGVGTDETGQKGSPGWNVPWRTERGTSPGRWMKVDPGRFRMAALPGATRSRFGESVREISLAFSSHGCARVSSEKGGVLHENVGAGCIVASGISFPCLGQNLDQ